MADTNTIRNDLERISDRLEKHGNSLTSEEAIKTVLVSPLLVALGHDPSDPDLVTVGQKTADGRADYTVLDADGKPVMLVAISSNPDDADSARSRSMAGLSSEGAGAGLLTDGRRHRFHLLTTSGLSPEPFLSFDIGDDIDTSVLLPLSRDTFDLEAAVAAARTTRPADIAWDYLLEQADAEGPLHSAIVRHLTEQGVGEERAALGASDALQRVGRVLRGEELAVAPLANAEEGEGDDDRRALTGDEMAAMEIVKEIVGRIVDPSLVFARQAKTYLALNYTDNNRKTICRLYLLSQSARYVGTFEGRNETKQRIPAYGDVAEHAEAILNRLRELDPGAFHNKSISDALAAPLKTVTQADNEDEQQPSEADDNQQQQEAEQSQSDPLPDKPGNAQEMTTDPIPDAETPVSEPQQQPAQEDVDETAEQDNADRVEQESFQRDGQGSETPNELFGGNGGGSPSDNDVWRNQED